jgi:hypothetical protein
MAVVPPMGGGGGGGAGGGGGGGGGAAIQCFSEYCSFRFVQIPWKFGEGVENVQC